MVTLCVTVLVRDVVHPLAIAILADLVNQAQVPTARSRPVDLDVAAKHHADLLNAWLCRRLGLVDL